MIMTVESNRDPLRPDKLPPTEGMALQYRIETGHRHAPYWAFFFVTAGILSLVLVFALQLLARYANTGPWLALALLVCTVWACWCAASGDWSDAFGFGGWLFFVFSAVAGAAVWLAVRFFAQASATPATQLILLAASVAFLAFLADQVMTHFVAWRSADPLVDPKARERIHCAWSRRFLSPIPLSTKVVQQTALGSLGDFRCSFVLLLAALFLTVLATLIRAASPFYGLFVATTLLVFLLIIVGIWISFGERQPLHTIRLVCQAVAIWISYDPNDTRAPGVFKSPAGSCARRQLLTGFSVFLVAAASVPFAAYFPIVLLFGRQDAWVRAANEPFFWEFEKPSPTPVFSELTPFQASYVNSLSFRDREAYVAEARVKNEKAYQRAEAANRVNRLFSTPEAWLVAAVRGSISWDARFMFALVVALACSVAYPILLALTVLTLVSGRTLRLVDGDLAAHPRQNQRMHNDWDAYIERLQGSRFPATRHQTQVAERDHVFLGVNAHYGYPVLLHRSILHEHCHILGDSGSGKTALGLAPMIAQLTRLSGRLACDPETPPSGQVSIVIIDLKGDRALFHGARYEAKKAGLPFKWFTNTREHATFAFNPFQQSHIKDLTTSQRAEILLQALGLRYGEFYGAGYFSSINQTVLRRYLHKYHPSIFSFQDLSAKLQSPAMYKATFDDRNLQKSRRDDWGDAAHLLSCVDSLSAVSSLNVTPDQVEQSLVGPEVLEHQIDMADVLKRPQVIYFSLSSITETAAVQGIAKLALYALLTAADLREPGTSAQVYCFIDEFQQIVANNLELVLRQARSKNIACILANQNITDLDTKDGNLMHTVEANTAFKQVFRASSQFQRERLIDASGEREQAVTDPDVDLCEEELFPQAIDTDMPIVGADGQLYYRARQAFGPRFRINDVINASYEDNQSLVLMSKGSGYTQYGGYMFALQSSFHIDQQRYQARTHAPWPEPSEMGCSGTFVASQLDAEVFRRIAATGDAAHEPPKVPQEPADQPHPVTEEQAMPTDSSLIDAVQAFKKGTKR